MSSSTFEIKGRAKARVLLGAAAVSVSGMVVMLLSSVLAWGGAGVTVGVALAGVGIGLVLMAQDAARKSSVMARLDDKGFALVSSRTQFGLAWSDVRTVSMRANELIVRDAKGQEVKIVAPPGSRSEELDSLAAAMSAALDANRGYGRRRKG